MNLDQLIKPGNIVEEPDVSSIFKVHLFADPEFNCFSAINHAVRIWLRNCTITHLIDLLNQPDRQSNSEMERIVSCPYILGSPIHMQSIYPGENIQTADLRIADTGPIAFHLPYNEEFLIYNTKELPFDEEHDVFKTQVSVRFNPNIHNVFQGTLDSKNL